MTRWLEDPGIRSMLQVNTYNEIEWFNGEAMDNWLNWMMILGTVDVLTDAEIPDEEKTKQLVLVYDWVTKMDKAAGQSGYQVSKLLTALGAK